MNGNLANTEEQTIAVHVPLLERLTGRPAEEFTAGALFNLFLEKVGLRPTVDKVTSEFEKFIKYFESP